ncbi:DNA topoisomerase 3-alpha [Tritrichomonas musculus]|uniref:DNA topoisomerase n=1 Tax=Tritrichomonas musculus TaxID=1915356 RepID=A0ABR2HF21_9EUKA
MTTILCVAEKPSVARTAAKILSNGRFKTDQTTDKFIKNFRFKREYKNEEVDVIFTSVKGHLFGLEFPEDMNSWHSVDPYLLFSCDVNWVVQSDMKRVHANLKRLSKESTILMLWLDNDREGEKISEEVEEVCLKSNSKLKVLRCRFSALSETDLVAAFNHPTKINRADALAVKLRSETDLRAGTAFTRFQTIRLRRTIEQIKQEKLEGEKKTISYGTCQFPTLGFIVDAYKAHENFVAETFWYLCCVIEKDRISCELKWSRKRLFCKLSTLALYSSVLSNPRGNVIDKETKQTSKLKPFPLTTVELQRRVSKYLKIDPHTTMNIVEKLYSNGFISYPRTETDSYPDSFKFEEVIQSLSKSEDPSISNYSRNFVFDDPRSGSHSDNAHPPIYPIKVPKDLKEDEMKIFNFIARHFLATVSKNAIGEETKVFFNIGDEDFTLKGLHIIERNFLDIYVYTPWNGKIIPSFSVDEEIQPKSIKMLEGQTTAPSLITEPKLIKLMDQEGIGTDATIADHIHKITSRNYCVKKSDTFYPTRIGLALINGYNKMGFDFDKPKLRADLEKTMQKVSSNPDLFDDEKNRIIKEYKDAYKKVVKNVNVLEDSLSTQMRLPEIIQPSVKKKKSSSVSSSQKVKARKESPSNSRKSISHSQNYKRDSSSNSHKKTSFSQKTKKSGTHNTRKSNK